MRKGTGATAYRYGFNGKELDKNGEFGSLNHYDYGFRIYNPGIGRFLSVDPLTQKYPELTPYQFASNTPIMAIDLDGLERAIIVNSYVNGIINGTSITQVSNRGSIMNLNAQGNGINALTLSDVLEINIGQLPDNTQPFVVRQSFNPDENRIINNGADVRRAFNGGATTALSDKLDDVGGFSFPGAVPGSNQMYMMNGYIGTWSQVPVFEDRQITSTSTETISFPATELFQGRPFGVNPGTGEVLPLNNTDDIKFKSVLNSAKANKLKQLDLVTVVFGSKPNFITTNWIQKVQESIKLKYNYSGKINVGFEYLNFKNAGGLGDTKVSTPGGKITRTKQTTRTEKVQTGVVNQLNE